MYTKIPHVSDKVGFLTNKLIAIFLIAVLGFMIGAQIYDPSKRMIEAAAGIVLITLIARFPLIWSISFFILMYAFPFSLKIGNSNVIFVPIILVIWLMRVTMKNVERPIGSLVDWTIVFMTVTYIISFYNNPGGQLLEIALRFMLGYFMTIGFFYLIVNFVRDEGSLERIAHVAMFSCFCATVFCTLEMLFPGRVLIPGWLYTPHKKALVLKDLRVKGPFFDYELVAEYFAVNLPVIVLMLVRAKRMLYRFAYAGLIISCVGLLLATSTRGAFISLTFGVVYMLIIMRKDLNIVKLTYIMALIFSLFFVMEFVVAKYTISGGMLPRLKKTKFHGVIPDTRKKAWPMNLERAREHILIGHSPAWDFSDPLTKGFWPHNTYLYYLNITGVFGLMSFLLLLFTLFRSSVKLKARTLHDPSFARAFMMALHISLVIFMVDIIKIDYLRNPIYIYFVWMIFGFIAATHNIIMKERHSAVPAASPAK